MIIQNPDGSLVDESFYKRNAEHSRYYAEIAPAEVEQQSSLVERIIAMAFDVLGARHVEVRVHDGEEC